MQTTNDFIAQPLSGISFFARQGVNLVFGPKTLAQLKYNMFELLTKSIRDFFSLQKKLWIFS